MPGGDLAVEIGEDDSLRQAGPVDCICRGELADGFATALRAG